MLDGHRLRVLVRGSEAEPLFRNILVPLDGTDEGAAALRTARTLAETTNASLRLVTVIPTDAPPEAEWDAGEYLHHRMRELETLDLAVQTRVRRGDPAAELIDEVSAAGVDLVVMSTHSRSGLSRLIQGSVSEKVLLGTSVPTLLLRSGARALRAINNILVPVDGTGRSSAALNIAAPLALAAQGAHLDLIQVVPPMSLTSIVDGIPVISLPDPQWIGEDSLAGPRAEVAELCRTLRERGLSAQGTVTMAPVVEGILREARSADPDLVVMATRALTGLPRTLFGSIADTLVRTTERPVLLIRERRAPTPSYMEHTGQLAGIVGAAGALVGLLAGGPLGAVMGAGVGLGLGTMVAYAAGLVALMLSLT